MRESGERFTHVLSALTIVLGLIAVIVAIPHAVSADVVDIAALKDNTIYQENTNFSNGADDHFVAGSTDGHFIWDRIRGLIEFDIAGNVPAGATITSAQLTLYMSRNIDTGARSVSLHALTPDWGEGTSNAPRAEDGVNATANDATWDDRFYPGIPWGTAGGDGPCDPCPQ